MTRTRLKICCIGSAEEAEVAIRAGVDALGLVGAMPSGPGVIDDALIRDIAHDLPAGVSAFLLTQERRAEEIAGHALRCGVSTVQVVDHVDATELARLRALLPYLRVVQVVHVEGPEALDLLAAYEPHVHAFLLDSGTPKAAVPLLGGTGRVHDWDVSMRFVRQSRRPVFLAGGLNPGNAADAVRRVRPFGLDICSGVRTDGRLDADKLRQYVHAVRGADVQAAAAFSSAGTGSAQCLPC